MRHILPVVVVIAVLALVTKFVMIPFMVDDSSSPIIGAVILFVVIIGGSIVLTRWLSSDKSITQSEMNPYKQLFPSSRKSNCQHRCGNSDQS
jgi:hypothetical protein